MRVPNTAERADAVLGAHLLPSFHPRRAEEALPERSRHQLVVTMLSHCNRATKLGAASPRTGTRVGDTCSAEASEREDSLAAALSLYHPRGSRRSFARLAPQPSGGQPGPRVSRDLGRQEIRRSHRRAPGSTGCGSQHKSRPPTGCSRRSAQTARDCAAGEREGGSSVPPRNTRKTLPQLKFSKAIRSNTAAYSLNTRYFCNPCSASAPPPDGKAPQRRGGRRHGPPRFRARAAPGPRRSPRGTPSTRVRTPGPAGRPRAAGGGGAPAGLARGRRRDTA